MAFSGNSSTRLRAMVQIALLAAVLITLDLTGLGMITTTVIAITTLHIPVIIGGILLGPAAGGILGGVFGAISMLEATFRGSAANLIFAPAASGNPVGSIVLCFVPRILLGVLAGFLFILLKRIFGQITAIAVTAAVATVFHTVSVLGLIWLIFKGLKLWQIFWFVVQVNGLIEIGAALLLSAAICKPLLKYTKNGG